MIPFLKHPLFILAAFSLPPAIYLGTQGDPAYYSRSAVIATDAVPTNASPTFDLMNVNGWRLQVCAPSGMTLGGSGTFHTYLISNKSGNVHRNPDLDKTITVTSTSCEGAPCRCEVWTDVDQRAQLGGGLYYVASGVTITDVDGGVFTDGGQTVGIAIDGWRNRR